MTQETKHTPTPWSVHDHKDKRHNELAVMAREAPDQNGELGVKVACVLGSKLGHCSFEVAKENAAFIVRACNSHDVLVEALRKIKTGNVDVFDEVMGCYVSVSMDIEEASEIASEALKLAGEA